MRVMAGLVAGITITLYLERAAWWRAFVFWIFTADVRGR